MILANIKTSYSKSRTFVERVVFKTPHARSERIVFGFLLSLLFVLGCLHWMLIFNNGNVSFTALDWVKESAYLDTLREAQFSNTLPWKWVDSYYQTEYFLGNPEIVLTPDILLLRWLSNPTFALMHTILFYTIGFIGSLALARKLRATILAFLTFWLLLNFNGYIVSHLAMGHFQWTGYFALPLYFLFLIELTKTPSKINSKNKLNVLAMALLLGLLFWNGSFHIAIWCLMFLFLTSLLARNRKILPRAIAIALLGAILGFGRILPALFSFRGKELPHFSGYYNLTMLVDAITRLRSYSFNVGQLGWWEYDMYIGFFGFALLVFACVRYYFRSHRNLHLNVSILLAALIMALFSLAETYSLIIKLPIPFSDIERVPSRFIVFPFIAILIFAFAGIVDLSKYSPTLGRRFVLISVPFIAYELLLHSLTWRIILLEKDNPQSVHPTLELIPVSIIDSVYKNSVFIGWSISLIATLVIFVFLWKTVKLKKGSHSSVDALPG